MKPLARYLVLVMLAGGCAPTAESVLPPLPPLPPPTTVDPVPPSGPPPQPRPPGARPLSASSLAAVWATEGGHKIAREDRRVTAEKKDPKSSVWDGEAVSLFGARNEVVNVAIVLEAGDQPVESLAVSFRELTGPMSFKIRSTPPTPSTIFDWTKRNIELFRIGYLQIRGVSTLTWEQYDERHVPERFRRPFGHKGKGKGKWTDRPDHDKHYPDICEPIEVVPTFGVAARSSQLIWVDIYIPKSAPPGRYSGTFAITEAGKTTHRLPVGLTVRKFALPDVPTAKTMMQLGYADINERYLGLKYPNPGALGTAAVRIRDRHFLLAHRHKIALIDANSGPDLWDKDAPRPDWHKRLDGTLFTAKHGYDGPGVGVGNGVFSIGTYGSWGWKKQGKAGMVEHTNAWGRWFDAHSPQTQAFVYLIDESGDFPKIERWSNWMATNKGPGRRLLSMATVGLVDAVTFLPSMNAPTGSVKVAPTGPWEKAANTLRKDPKRVLWLYNGARPASGTLAMEDDGVAMRQLGWVQFKKQVERWFVWESTYYNNFQGGTGQTNVWKKAHTFGAIRGHDDSLGQTGWNYTNGDGVLFYPGTDLKFPEVSRGVKGPFASLRLKYWRRGVQDHDYLTLAAKVAPKKVRSLVQKIIPKVLWDYGVDSITDPTYTHTDISWSNDPEVWEAARKKLADLIEAGRGSL